MAEDAAPDTGPASPTTGRVPDLQFKGRAIAQPTVAALLHSVSRSTQPGRSDEDFLPSTYLKVVEAYDLSSAARSGPDGSEASLDSSDDQSVLVLELADGSTLITSAGRMAEALARNRIDTASGDPANPAPPSPLRLDQLGADDATARGLIGDLVGGVVSKVFRLTVDATGLGDTISKMALDQTAKWVGQKAEGTVIDAAYGGASWLAAKGLMWAIEQRLNRPAGFLYAWSGDGELATGDVDDDGKPKDKGTGPAATETRPMLVFIHGTGSSTMGSFGDLQRSDRGLWSVLEQAFPGGIYGFEHRSLSESPIDNAIQLLNALPDKAQLSIVSHSRGGQVADLLCLADLERCIAAYGHEFPDAAMAPDLKDAHAGQRRQLTELAKLLRNKQPQIQRYVRVASPAQGTKLASANIDVFLSGMLTLFGALPWFYGNPLYAGFKRVVIEMAKRRTDPHLVPGIECMLPDSPLASLLATADVRPGVQLGLVAGDLAARNLLVRLGVMLTDFVLFDQVDNDLVVDTGAMLGGIAAKAQARVLFDRGPKVTHFSYFSNLETRSALRDWLVSDRPDELPAFQALPGHFDSLDALGIQPHRSAAGTDRPVVVLLPGIMGSHLAVPKDGRIWLNPLRIATGGLDELAFDDRQAVEAEAVFDSAYGALCRHLSSSHRVVAFPYDWRQPLDVLGDRLGEALARLQAETQQPIRLLAHSMGGLVVRACIHRRRSVMDSLMARDGARLVMLGTPNNGSHAMVENLLGKGSNLRTLVRLDLKHDMQQVLDLVAGFPGALQLLPRPGFEDAFQGQPGGGEPVGRRDWFNDQTWTGLQPLNRDLWFGDGRCAKPKQPVLNRSRWLWDQDAAQMAANKATGPALPKDYTAKSAYVFGVAPNTACGLRVDGGRLRLVGTPKGDGTVTWQSGQIDGIGRRYYLPAAHGDLLNTRPYFDALTDLLVSGDSAGLPTTPPALRAIDAARPRVYDAGPPELADSGNAELALLGGTPSRQVLPRPLGQLTVSVRGMDLRFITQPMLVGHYQSDPIAGPQRLIDTELLDGKLSQRHNLGLYAGPLGSATVVLQAPNNAELARGSLVGAVVTGLGDYTGALSQDNLAQAVRAGVLRYLLQAVDVLGPAERALPLGTLLLGYNSSATLSVRASLEALVRGVVEANARFKDTTGLKLRVDRLDIIELYLDTAITAAYELRLLQPRLAQMAAQLDTQLVCHAELMQGEGLRQRLFDSGSGNYWPRLMVTDAGECADDDRARPASLAAPAGSAASAAAQGLALPATAPPPGSTRLANRLRYLYVGQRARAESLLQQRQPGLIETLVGQQISNTVWNEDFGRLLFQLLVPPDFKDTLRQQERIVLVVDEATANLPWEMMLPDVLGDADQRQANQRVPLAVRTPVIRQLASTEFRRQVRQAPSRNALVVGNPSVEGFASCFPDPVNNPKGLPPPALPGAEAEATEVARQLGNLGYQVSRAIGADTTAATVLAKLYRQPYRLLHISAHGVFEQRHADGLARSGVVLSGGLLITAAEIEAMEQVPELVFLNCCHLGQVDAASPPELQDTVRHGNKLAASVARALIEIGVRCVVVAGWAVTDSLAQQFGQVFYRELMQERRSFGDAVFEARKALWQQAPKDITWGAFQAYGDPGWRAEPRREGAGFGGDGSDPFVSMDELLDQLARARAEMTRRPGRQTDADRKALVQRVEAMLKGRVPPAWLGQPALLSALGATWRDLGEAQRAYDALLTAVQADDQTGRVPIRDVEQLANIEARKGEKQARAVLDERLKAAIRADAGTGPGTGATAATATATASSTATSAQANEQAKAQDGKSADGKAADPKDEEDKTVADGEAMIERAIQRLTILSDMVSADPKATAKGTAGPSAPRNAERSALMGSAYKRLAAVKALRLLTLPKDAAADAVIKLSEDMDAALSDAIAAYRQGEGQPGDSFFKPYNVLNRLALEGLLSREAGDAVRNQVKALAAQCRQALASAFGANGDVWLAVMQPETVLVEALCAGDLASADQAVADAAWQAVSTAYAQAVATLLIKPWQLDSVTTQLGLLITFSQARHRADQAVPGDSPKQAGRWLRQAQQLDRLARQLQPSRPPTPGLPPG